jgi:hypothetical protein
MVYQIFLYIILHDDSSLGERFRVRMPNMEVCQQAIATGKIAYPAKTGNDYEVMGVMFCATGDFERHDGNNGKYSWKKD